MNHLWQVEEGDSPICVQCGICFDDYYPDLQIPVICDPDRKEDRKRYHWLSNGDD